MDEGSGSSIWHRFAKLFHKDSDVEQAILEATEDGDIDLEEQSMLLRVLKLDELQAQDIMIPRTDIDCASEKHSLEEFIEIIQSSGHSRIPVYKDNKDNIVGILYAKDLLVNCSKQETGLVVSKLMRIPFFVPETKPAFDLLHELRARKNHMAIVLDEYGGVSGLVTIEDILEEIVGEIEDEHDSPKAEEITITSPTTARISGRTDLEDLEEELHITLESDEVDTLGGYLSHIAGHVPKEGESFDIESIRYTITQADAKQIHSINIELLNPSATFTVKPNATSKVS